TRAHRKGQQMKARVGLKRGAIAALAAGTTFAGTLLFTATAPADAATATPSGTAAHSVVRHPELDWAGSQVAKHEPHGNTHGGGWSKDGKTLPGMLDMEWNPYGAACYGLSASGMVNWIKSFSNEYHAKTSRFPVIYTATSWWSQCTGNVGDFSSTNPLMIAN